MDLTSSLNQGLGGHSGVALLGKRGFENGAWLEPGSETNLCGDAETGYAEVGVPIFHKP